MAMPYAAGHWPSNTDLLPCANARVTIEDPFFLFFFATKLPLGANALAILQSAPPYVATHHSLRPAPCMGDVHAICPVLHQCMGDDRLLLRPAPAHGR